MDNLCIWREGLHVVVEVFTHVLSVYMQEYTYTYIYIRIHTYIHKRRDSEFHFTKFSLLYSFEIEFLF